MVEHDDHHVEEEEEETLGHSWRLGLRHGNRLQRDTSGSVTDISLNNNAMVYDFEHFDEMQVESWGVWRKASLFGMLSLLVICGTAETASYSANGKVYMVPYRCFLNQLTVFCCIVFFTIAEALSNKYESTNRNTSRSFDEESNHSLSFNQPFMQQQQQHAHSSETSFDSLGLDFVDHDEASVANETLPHYNLNALIFLMGFLDTVGLYLNVLASHDVGGSLRVILQNLSIPISMGFSFFILGRRFSMRHIFSATLVFSGIILCMVKVLRGDQESSPAWSVVLALSCVPLALGGCLKEWVLIMPHYGCRAHTLNKQVAIVQFLLGLLFVPLGLKIQNEGTENDYYVPLSDVFGNFWAGLRCGVFGLNTYTEDHRPYYAITHCHEALISTWVYITTVCLFNLLMLWVIREGTAVLFFIANAVIIPCVTLLSTSDLYQKIGLKRDTYTAWQIFGLICTVLGCFNFGIAMIHRSEQESRSPRFLRSNS